MANSLPTVTANIALVLSASVAADIRTHWLTQRVGSPGTLATPISESDTVLTLVGNAAPGLGFVAVAPGNTVIIEDETMEVTAVDELRITVVRVLPSPLVQPARAHDAGTTVSLLKYADPGALLRDEALRPWAQQVVAGLGANSATFGADVSLTLTLNL